MKTIPLKTVTLVEGNKTTETYVELIKTCVRHVAPGGNGIDVEDMAKRLRIVDAVNGVKAGAAEVKLEDADAALLCEAVGNMRWAIVSKALVDFVADMKQACA
jgi:hypothetical protein